MIVVSSVRGEPTFLEAALPQTAVAGEACVFRGCRGFFHAGTGPVGIVLCAPWGFEDLIMRKSWRLLAEAVAAAGFPCLRFDYPGTGNSLGAMTDIVDIAQWTQSIGAAADFLRAYSGVKRFVFIGQSLGAALAVEAARQRNDVVGLIALAPVIKGRTYVRELLATSKLVADKIGITVELAASEALSVLGFTLSKRLVESLKAIDLMAGATPGVADAIVFDQADRKAGAELSEYFKRNGSAARLEIVPPYHLMISDATIIQPLPADAARIVAALTALYPPSAPAMPARVPLLPATLRAETFREEPMRFGPQAGLHGTICHPAKLGPGLPVVLFLNRGLNPQIGWRRVSVDHARALAAAGFASLRMDATGLGESADVPGRDASLIYADVMLADVRAAVDALVVRGYQRIMLVGICSGAYMALSAAQADPRVTDLVAVNPQRLVWNPRERPEQVIRYGLRSMDDYLGDVRSRHAIRKLIQSRKRIVPAFRFLVRRNLAGGIARLTAGLQSRLLPRSMPARVNHLFSTFAARGTRVSLVYSVNDPGLRELRTYFGAFGRALRFPGTRVSILPDADHNLTTSQASAWLLDHIRSFGGGDAPEQAVPVEDSPSAADRARRAVEGLRPLAGGGGGLRRRERARRGAIRSAVGRGSASRTAPHPRLPPPGPPMLSSAEIIPLTPIGIGE